MSGEGLSENDPNSWSQPELAVVKHVIIKWEVHLEEQAIHGEVILHSSRKQDDAQFLDLDSKDLVIQEVYDDCTSNKLQYDLGTAVGNFGSRLRIHLPSEGKELKIRIKYLVTKSATALQWLTPEQTSGKIYPFIFSQCQAIHARSLLPCQDTPSVKFTYSAEVTVPSHLDVLMSALRDGQENDGKGNKKFRFTQPKVIPSYLIAIAVGCLESRKIGPRSSVWAEKEIIEIAENEFSQTEEFLKVAESFCGPYEWGIYDLLVLPPSFPYGGMENPCVTFVTPTVLAGDKSLVDVIAHEISHSWMGNLITNKNFEHFWLNEGFTVFMERKILGRIHDEKTRHFLSLCGLSDLKITVNDLGHDNNLTKLVTDLKGVNPDDSYSICPYEKGYTFLFYLETVLGGSEVFDPFIIKYVQRFKNLSISTNDFKDFFEDYFKDKKDALEKIDWDMWLYSPGMPPVIPEYNTELLVAVKSLAKRWIEWDSTTESNFTIAESKELSPKQMEAFLTLLLDEKEFSVAKLEKMREVYKMNELTNCEIVFRWLRLCIKNRWEEQIQPGFNFLNKQGRMKYVRPLYRELIMWEDIQGEVIRNFREIERSMMYVTAYTVSKDLGLF